MKFGTSRKPQTLSFGPGGCIDSFHKLKKAIFFFVGGGGDDLFFWEGKIL